MKVLYAGGTSCDYRTLQRLILIADEIAFMDRPSVTFGDWGTIGTDSEFRKINTAGAPIKFDVHAPPSGPASRLYQSYIEADLKSPHFISAFFDGLTNNQKFQSRFIQLGANYTSGTGKDILEALLQDKNLISESFAEPVNGKLMFKTDTSESRRETMKSLLVEASIHVTNALVVSEASGLTPVSDDPYFCKLLALRTGNSEYVGKGHRLTPYLGIAIASSVIPDEILDKLEIKDLFEYRQSAKDAYESWSAEIDRLALMIKEMDPNSITKEIPRIFNSEVQPKLIDYQNEMKANRDKLFGNLIKKVVVWEMPTISAAYLSSLDFTSAIATFATALAPAVPGVVDYFNKRRDIHRRNSMAYLVGLKRIKDV